MITSLKRSLANPFFWKASKSAVFRPQNHFAKKITQNPFVFQINKQFSSQPQEMSQEEIMKTKNEFSGYLDLGKNALLKSDLKSAAEHFTKAIEVGIKVYGESSEYLAASYFSLGSILNRVGQRKEAKDLLGKAHEILSQNPQKNRNQLLSIEKVLGIRSQITAEVVEQEKNKLIATINELQKQKTAENLMKIAKLLISLSALYKREGNKTEAIAHKKAVTEIFARHPKIKSSDLFLSHLDLGIDYRENKQFNEALASFEKAFDVISKRKVEGSDGLKGLGYQNIAHVHFAQKNFEEAIKYYAQALEIQEISETRDEEMIKMLNLKLGVCNFSVGNAKQAIKHFEKSLEADQENPDEMVLASTFKYLGDCYIQLEGENSEKGKRHHARAKAFEQAFLKQLQSGEGREKKAAFVALQTAMKAAEKKQEIETEQQKQKN